MSAAPDAPVRTVPAKPEFASWPLAMLKPLSSVKKADVPPPRSSVPRRPHRVGDSPPFVMPVARLVAPRLDPVPYGTALVTKLSLKLGE